MITISKIDLELIWLSICGNHHDQKAIALQNRRSHDGIISIKTVSKSYKQVRFTAEGPF